MYFGIRLHAFILRCIFEYGFIVTDIYARLTDGHLYLILYYY